MSKAVLASHGDGAQLAWQLRTETAVQDLPGGSCRWKSSSHFSSAKGLTGPRSPLIDSEGSRRRASVSDSSPSRMVGGVQLLQFRVSPIYKVLWFWRTGYCNSFDQTRISRDLPFGSSLAVKGDALIHGPCLVARPVRSEWRNHRPYRVSSQPN